jgi:hypothetical protein
MNLVYSRLVEGDDVDGASVLLPLTNICDGVNDLPDYSIHPHALNEHHLPTIIGGVLTNVAPGLQAVVHPTGTRSNYSNIYPGYATSVFTGGGAKWGLISDGVNSLEILFDAVHLGMTNPNRIGGLLIKANIHLYSILGACKQPTQCLACFGLAWKSAAGVWSIIPRTERFLNRYYTHPAIEPSYEKYDVPITTLLTENDTGATHVIGIKAVVALYTTQEIPTDPWTDQMVQITSSNMSVLPLHGALI